VGRNIPGAFHGPCLQMLSLIFLRYELDERLKMRENIYFLPNNAEKNEMWSFVEAKWNIQGIRLENSLRIFFTLSNLISIKTAKYLRGYTPQNDFRNRRNRLLLRP
jgi:hypothetical protein